MWFRKLSLVFSFFSFLLLGNPSFANELDVYIVITSGRSDSLERVFSDPCISGVTLYVGWSRLQPEENQYDFSILKNALDLAVRNNKKVNIGLLTGRWVPQWVFKKQIEFVEWDHVDGYVEDGISRKAKAPVPWDKNYLQYFSEFLSEASFLINTYESAINSIAITGGSNTNGLEANFYMPMAAIGKTSFSFSKYKNNWEYLIDMYENLFPGIPKTFAVHEQFFGFRDSSISKYLVNYGVKKYGKKFIPQVLAFTEEDWFKEGNSYADLVILRPSGSDFVLQSIRTYSKSNDFERFEKMKNKAKLFNPLWLEIWLDDFLSGYYCKSY